MAPVFGEGGNLPTRFFELDREMLKREGFDFEKFAKKVRRRSTVQNQLSTSQAMQDTVTSRELFERMPTRPALAEPEVAAHKVRSYEDDSTDWAPSGGRAAAPEQPAQPARRRPVRAARDVLARRQKKLRLPNGSVVVMTPCAVDASVPPRGFRTRRTSARRSR